MTTKNVAPGAKTLAGKPCAEARKLLGWSRRELAAAALVAERTVQALEEGGSKPHPRAVENIRIALEAAGAQFSPAGLELRQPGSKELRTQPPAAAPRERQVA